MNLRDFFITNAWWGKLLGGIFGYLSAGPAGALFGILIGNLFDRGLSSHLSDPHWLYHKEKVKATQKIFFEATFRVMGHIAKSDGRVSEQEIIMARQVMNEMRLNREQKASAKQLFTEGKSKTFNLDKVLNELLLNCRNNRNLLKLFIEIQFKAAQVDGLSKNKIQVLDAIFSHLGFAPFHRQYHFYQHAYDSFTNHQSDQRQQNTSNNYRPTSSINTLLDQAYALLEVKPGSSKNEVKRAYRKLLSKNHPDKLIAQGLPQSMIKVANDKTQQIVKAYNLICENKGW